MRTKENRNAFISHDYILIQFRSEKTRSARNLSEYTKILRIPKKIYILCN
jgi:hypothetical protein